MKKILQIISALWFPLLILIFLILLSITFVFGQSTEIASAKLLAEREQFDKAIQNLKDAQSKYPDASEVYYHLGLIQLQAGDTVGSAASFNNGIGLNEKGTLNYAGRGRLFLMQGETENAEGDFSKALSLSRFKDAATLKAIAEAYLLKDKYTDNAITLLLKARDLDKNDTETLILLGHAYLKKNDGGKAVTSYENAAALDAKSAKPYYSIGMVYLRSKNFDVAEASFLKALQIDPSYTLGYKELGELYYQKKNGVQAARNYERYLQLTERPKDGLLRYAFFLFMAKDFKQANEVFATLIADGNSSPVVKRYYAYSLFEAGEHEKSTKTFDEYFAAYGDEMIEPNDYNYYGKLLLQQRQDSLAIDVFAKSLKLDTNQPEILQLQGETLLKAKRYQEAVGAFESLASLKNLSSQDLYALGRAYYFNSQFEKADTTFQKLSALQPHMTVGYVWTARAKSNLDPETDKGLAKPFYEAVIEKAAAAPEKNKQELKEAYSYLGYYYFLKQEKAVCKAYWEKVLQIDPADMKAKEALKALNVAR